MASNIFEIYIASDRFQIQNLKKIVVEMIKPVDKENALGFLMFCNKNELDDLKLKAFEEF